MRVRPVIASAFGVLLAAMPAARGQDRSDLPGCTLEPGDRATVTSVLDAETLVLADGTRVKLAGITAPLTGDVAESGVSWKPADEARRFVERQVLGRTIRLGYAGRRLDRWGSTIAHVFVEGEAATEIHPVSWLQGSVLRAGHARTASLPGTTACMSELLAHEAVGRAGSSGVWREPAYAIVATHDRRALLEGEGSFVVAEGRAMTVNETRGRAFINFGPDRQRDFTVVLGPVVRRAAIGAGYDLKGLAGQRVRVRGWVSVRGGPQIELHHPHQIEVLDRGTGVPGLAPVPEPTVKPGPEPGRAAER